VQLKARKGFRRADVQPALDVLAKKYGLRLLVRSVLRMAEVENAKPSPKADPSSLVRSKEARELLGGRGVLDLCERAGWCVPVKRGKRLTLYRRTDIEAALQRISWGELP
jgi:hypothetical protein